MFATDYPETPEKRRPHATGGVERRLTEAAVMLAFAIHLLEEAGGEGVATVCPDGEHAKIFDIAGCLRRLGFEQIEARGTTNYGGIYKRHRETIIVDPTPGKGDVAAEVKGRRVIAECKGAVINSNHNGQRSRTRKGLSELIGQLMLLPDDGARQVAVIPETADTARLAPMLAKRAAKAGIEIALVKEDGCIRYV